jgi:hypothetical protein
MKKLNYQTYMIQGGDWGAVISTAMALKYPNNVLSVHVIIFSLCIVFYSKYNIIFSFSFFFFFS